MNVYRNVECAMDSTSGGSSSAIQLRKLCKHILGPEASDEVLSAQFRAALQILSSSSSGQENVRDDEFVVSEKIKKHLVGHSEYWNRVQR